MKKKKTRKITAAGILAGTMMTSFAFLPGCNRPTSVYGPPPEYDPDENLPTGVYGPPEIETEDPAQEEYDPENNINEDVYGPPEFYEEEDQK